MKQILIILLAMVVLPEAIYGQDDNRMATHDDIEYMQAIVARTLNVVSVPEKEERLYNLSGSALTIDSINRIVNLEDNTELTNYIINLKPAEGASLKDALTYYTEKVFSQRTIKDFFEKKNRKSKLDETKLRIKSEIEEYIANRTQSIEDTEEDEVLAQFDSEEIDNTEESNSTVDTDETRIDEADESNSSGSSWLSRILTIMLFLAFLGIGGVLLSLYRNLRSSQLSVKAQNNTLREFKDLLVQKDRQIENYKRELSELRTSLDENLLELSKLKLSAHNGSKNIQVPKPPSIGAINDIKQPQAKEQLLYAVNSNGGMFMTTSRNYRKGHFMYRISTFDGQTGSYHFIDDPESLEIAKMSISNFIESACEIVNENQRSFSKVVTEQDGVVVSDGNAWRIVKKALVRLI